MSHLQPFSNERVRRNPFNKKRRLVADDLYWSSSVTYIEGSHGRYEVRRGRQ
jgi:hypothetical protein